MLLILKSIFDLFFYFFFTWASFPVSFFGHCPRIGTHWVFLTNRSKLLQLLQSQSDPLITDLSQLKLIKSAKSIKINLNQPFQLKPTKCRT
jgi:hypothetical protein